MTEENVAELRDIINEFMRKHRLELMDIASMLGTSFITALIALGYNFDDFNKMLPHFNRQFQLLNDAGDENV